MNKDWSDKREDPWKAAKRPAGGDKGEREPSAERAGPPLRRPGADEGETAFRKGRDDEWLEPVCGLHAVGSLFHCKPAAVERLFFDAETAPMLGELCKFLAKERKVYRQVAAAELERIAGTRGHGGVVAVARRRQPELATGADAALWAAEGMPLVILDGVKDPRLLGGIARVAAFYGLERLLLVDSRRQVRPTSAAYRASRGGLEMMEVRLVENVPSFVKGIRESYLTIGLEMEGAALPEYLELCPEEQVGKPVALVLGDEEMGLSEAARAACEHLVGVPGSGALDRLPVEAELALLLQRYVAEAF